MLRNDTSASDRPAGELNRLSELMGGSDESERTAVLPVAAEPAAGRRAANDEGSDATPTEAEGEPSDDLLDDEDYLALQPRKASRLTLTLVALLILVVGFLLGVEAQRFFG